MRSRLKRLVLVLALLAWAAPVAPTRAQRPCEDPRNALDEAEKKYDRQLFLETIKALEPCWRALAYEDRQDALRLMALAYYGGEKPDSMVYYVEELMRVNRRYQPSTAEDPLLFQDLVRERWPRWHENWWLRGALVVGLGGVSYLTYKSFLEPEPAAPAPLPGPIALPPPPR